MSKLDAVGMWRKANGATTEYRKGPPSGGLFVRAHRQAANEKTPDCSGVFRLKILALVN